MDRFLVVGSLFLVGCFSPKYGSGDLQCGPNGACPRGMTCIAGACYAPGRGPDLASAPSGGPTDMGVAAGDLSSPSDLLAPPPADLYVAPVSYPPAAVWVSSGGGAGVGSQSGARINLSIGGTVVRGAVAGSAGGQATFSYFSNNIIP